MTTTVLHALDLTPPWPSVPPLGADQAHALETVWNLWQSTDDDARPVVEAIEFAGQNGHITFGEWRRLREITKHIPQFWIRHVEAQWSARFRPR